MVAVPAKGEIVNVNISGSGKQRLQVGVSWDVQDKWVEKGFLFKKQEKIVETYDLDIYCYIFDEQKEFLEVVAPESALMMDSSEQIYHSGDNTTGRTAGDDEYISVNMAELPDNIHNIIFVITSPGNRPFKQIANAAARVSDGKTDQDQLLVYPGEGKGAGKTVFIFAGIYRDERQESGWALHNISEYPDNEDIEDWAEILTAFIP